VRSVGRNDWRDVLGPAVSHYELAAALAQRHRRGAVDRGSAATGSVCEIEPGLHRGRGDRLASASGSTRGRAPGFSKGRFPQLSPRGAAARRQPPPNRPKRYEVLPRTELAPVPGRLLLAWKRGRPAPLAAAALHACSFVKREVRFAPRALAFRALRCPRLPVRPCAVPTHATRLETADVHESLLGAAATIRPDPIDRR
jgi:hypothetical protein